MKKLTAFCIFSFMLMPYIAYAENHASEHTFFPLLPRVTFWGFAGSQTLGQADAMLPLYGNQESIFYLDAQGKTAFAADWLGSVGVGVRRVVNDQRILGAYLFTDRNVSDTAHVFWFVNPGLEYLSQTWDVLANTYLPVSAKQKYITTDFADNLGNYNDIQFQGHTQWDAILNEYETVGWGADAEVGRTIPHVPGLRAYVGGYHANPEKMEALNGVSTKVEYAINPHLSVNLKDTYDNFQHNQVLLGLKLTLGGLNQSPHDPYQSIRNRLLDTNERHLARKGSVSLL